MNGKSDIEINYSSLFIGLKNQEGWGNKTSALFVKNIFHFHNGKYDERLFIWEDTPKTIIDNDTFYLPVDAVIINIFNKLDNSKKWNFTNINKKIEEYEEYYEGTDEYITSLIKEILKQPNETEWLEFKHNNYDKEMIGEYISALSNSATLHG